MSQEYNKTVPMIVACLSIALCIASPLVYAASYFEDGNFLDTEKLDSYQKRFYLYLIVYCVVCVCIGLIPSMLLVKGIKENRPKLMAPWLYLNYFSLVAIIFIILALLMTSAIPRIPRYGISYSEYLPFVIAWFIMFLAVFPVQVLFNQFRKPAPVKPAPCVNEVKTSEDDKRYIPIFEEY